jgi:branched-chain amino acid transport system permease protein
VSAGLVLQVVVSGLAAGSIYALIALGFSLIYRMSGVLNFAHGDLVTLSIFAFLFFAGGGASVALDARPASVLLALCAAALGVTVAVALGLRVVAVAPFAAGSSAVGWIAGTAAAGLVMRSLIGLRFGAESYSFPDLLPLSGLGRGGVFDLPGGGVAQARDIAVLAIAMLLALAFDQWLTRSLTGRAMRAAADVPDAAQLVGISPARVQMLAWGIAGGLTAVAGLLLAPSRPITLELGVILGLKGIAAAVLGGLGSARGAVVAALLIGLLENAVTSLSVPGFDLGSLHIPQVGPAPGLHDVLALTLLVLALALVPRRLGVQEETAD